MIHLDTHALVWYLDGSAKVGRTTRARLERGLARDEVAVSSVVFWVIALLVDRGRMTIVGTVDQYRRRVLETGIKEAGLDGTAAIRAARLAAALTDPADCLIAATALAHGARLVTGDSRIIACGLVDVLNVRR